MRNSSAKSPIYIVDLNTAITERFKRTQGSADFATTMGGAVAVGSIVGKGDTLEILIWEAPPAVLFGNMIGSGGYSGGEGASASANYGQLMPGRAVPLPAQMVDTDGTIQVPFVGRVMALGRSSSDIEKEIIRRLRNKAHAPQVTVQITGKGVSTATVVGEVANSRVISLTSKGERILDALAYAGGSRQPVNKMTVQLTRGTLVKTIALEDIVRDPRQNVILAPGDVLALYFQPLSFTALGASGRNEEIPFEATGVTLAQALGRIGGLQDQRADPSGLFVFRFEKPETLGLDPRNPIVAGRATSLPMDAQGRIAVIYRINLRDPGSFFAAQNFPVRDKDILYVSNAPLADFQKILALASSIVIPLVTVQAAFNNN